MNHRSNKQRTGESRASSLLRSLLLSSVLCMLVVVFEATTVSRTPMLWYGEPHQSRQNSIETSSICPGIIGKFYSERNRSYLESLYEEAYVYHNLGGNFGSLESFLNEAIDYSYDSLGLTPFALDSEAAAQTASRHSVQDQIRTELKRRDKDNRGGYYQRSMPGKFQGPTTKDAKRYRALLTNDRFITVVEPLSSKRWAVGMGPTLDPDSCQGFHKLEGPPRRPYESKFICGWDKLIHRNAATYENLTNDRADPSRSCNMVSIGSNDEWGFEEKIVKNTDCQIATFDCTITNPKHKPNTDKVIFQSLCISGDYEDKTSTVNERKFGSYFHLLETAGMLNSSHIDYLKIDVEGYEFQVLFGMIREARERNLDHLLPEQIQVEIHLASWMYDLSWAFRTRNAGELMTFFSLMFRAGYVVVHVENVGHEAIREVLLLKTFCKS